MDEGRHPINDNSYKQRETRNSRSTSRSLSRSKSRGRHCARGRDESNDPVLEAVRSLRSEMSESFCKMESSINEIKSTLAKNEKKIKVLEQRVEEHDEKMISHDDAVGYLVKQVEMLQDKVDQLENHSRRSNIRIVGVPEHAEKGLKMHDFVRTVLRDALEIGPETPLTVERAHRTGPVAPVREGDKPRQSRAIIARLLNFQTKQDIMQRAYTKGELRYMGNRISIFHDYSAELLRKRKEYDPVKRALAAKNIKYSLIFPAKFRVFHNNQTHDFDSPAKAEPFLHSVGIIPPDRPAVAGTMRKFMAERWDTVGPRRSERQRDRTVNQRR